MDLLKAVICLFEGFYAAIRLQKVAMILYLTRRKKNNVFIDTIFFDTVNNSNYRGYCLGFWVLMDGIYNFLVVILECIL